MADNIKEKKNQHLIDKMSLTLLAGLSTMCLLGIIANVNKKGKTSLSEADRAFLNQKATLIEKGQPYVPFQNVVNRDLFLDMDGDLQTTEAIVCAGGINRRPSLNVAIRDMTNGTVKTVADWQKFGHLSQLKKVER